MLSQDRLFAATIAAVLLAGAFALALAVHRLPRAERTYRSFQVIGVLPRPVLR